MSSTNSDHSQQSPRSFHGAPPHGNLPPVERQGGRPATPFTLDINADKPAMPLGRMLRRSHRRPQRQRQMQVQRRPLHRRAAFIMSAVLLGVGIAGALKQNMFALPEAITSQIPVATDMAQAAGLGLDQIAITGHRFTSDDAIFKALDLNSTRTLWAFDPKAAQRKLEELPWVYDAELSRVYPGQLDVRITEREPFALWRHDGREELIDKTGRVLQAVSAGSVTHLPVVAGENAEREAGNLMVLLARYQPLARVFKWAERVDGRRWSLHLEAGGRIELPADGEALALSELEAKGQLATLLAGPPTIIDLRASGRIAIRSAPAATASSGQRSVAGIGSLIDRIEQSGRQP